NPLVQVMFAFQNVPRSERRLSGLSLRQIRPGKGLAKFDLGLAFRQDAGRLRAVLKYNTDLFDADMIARLAAHYQTLVEAVAAQPEQPLSALPVLTEVERRQVLVEWNATEREWGERRGVHQLFEAQAARTPDAAAALCGERELSYGELNARANQLARALRARGVGPGAYVPLLMPGGIEVVIGMLAVMKVGAAFVPLDLDWPVERIRSALRELPPGPALAGPRLPFGEALLERPVLRVDPLVAGPEAGDGTANLDLAAEAEAPIYAIYTSGSTGLPKAAVVPHRGITNRLLWMNEFFGPATAAAVLQTTRHVYDSAVWQLLWPLINGGKTVMPGPEAEVSAETLAQLIERHEVTITDFVPSVFNALVPQMVAAAPLRQQLRSLRAIVVGGEEITPATTYQFMAAFPGVRVINLYGPTEASIGCICYEVTGSEGDAIPIGRPIANVRVLVLDPDRNPVPVGVAGELYLGGACVGLGYLNDPEKTRASFVNPGVAEAGRGRLYRTGDRVRYRPDGHLEFLGRLDRQVKLRGLRIELGEIETALDRHPAVHESVVLLREDTPGDKRLVGYLVPAGPVPSSNELRGFLSRTVPEYMVPTIFVPLAELPRSPGGKVYRGALPRPDYTGPSLADVGEEPRTPTEAAIAGIWSEVLKLERVGIHHNFFELGGHSLLATQVVARIRTALGVAVPLRALFEAPTVAGLTEQVEIAHRLLEEVRALSPDEARAKMSAHQATLGEPRQMESRSI
ncbi:MAG: non-ribosomal peptide synthetase, partial [Gemmatimonadales bacterium]